MKLFRMDLLLRAQRYLAESRVAGEFRIALDKRFCFRARRLDELQVLERFHCDVGHAPLAAPDEFARAAQREIVFGELESVLRGRERLEAVLSVLAVRLREREA